MMVNGVQDKLSVVMTKAPFSACPPHIHDEVEWVFRSESFGSRYQFSGLQITAFFYSFPLLPSQKI